MAVAGHLGNIPPLHPSPPSASIIPNTFKMIITDKEIYNPTIPDPPPKDLVANLCRQKGLDFASEERYIRHMFFKNREAARVYTSAGELQDSINRILDIIRTSTGQDHGTVNFTDEPLTCYHGDIYRENFPVDRVGNLWVVDFDITGVLPASFANWPLDTKYKHPLPIPVRETIPLGTSKNLKAMFRAYRFNQFSVG
ncbi:uncharacterized protein BDV14DRAFT_196820 [Aspergillus stella-maris]|uniref:uncharacterized protein n=1 Tax=Aspergillus stella-maris TaxID=1810926 RepID=UPI003CCCF6E1